MKKILILTLMLLILASTVNALTGFTVEKVEFDGILLEGNSVYVELGQQVPVEVIVACSSTDPSDIKLEAKISGYEYEPIYASSEVFEAVASTSGPVMYRKSLLLDIPEDMNTESNEYKLTLFISDKTNLKEYSYNLYVSEPRHKVKIQDVILSPSSSTDAGNAVMVKVRIENFGQEQEKDVKVVAEIKDLGVSGRTYVDELPAYGEDNSVTNAGSIFVNIPQDARTGDYKVSVSVFYGGRTKYYYATHETKYIHINGVNPEPIKSDSMVSVTSSLNIRQEEKAVKVMITNLGKNSKTYTIEAEDTMPWAELKQDKETLTIGAGEVGELSVVIVPKLDGEHTLGISVKEDNQEIKFANVNVKVKSKGIASSTGWIIGVGIALVAIILVIVVFSFHGDKIKPEDIDLEEEAESEPTVQNIRKINGNSKPSDRPPRAPEGSNAFRKL